MFAANGTAAKVVHWRGPWASRKSVSRTAVDVHVHGKQGLEMLAQERPDLVFVDYMMPVMDGAGLLRGMAASEATVAQRCAGYTAFMRKPFKIIDVVSLTERLVGPL